MTKTASDGVLRCFIVVIKKTFRYSNDFSYNHLHQPEGFNEKRYKFQII